MTTFKKILLATAFVFTASAPLSAQASEVGDNSVVLDKLMYSHQYKEAVRTGAAKGHGNGNMNYDSAPMRNSETHDIDGRHRNYKLRF